MSEKLQTEETTPETQTVRVTFQLGEKGFEVIEGQLPEIVDKKDLDMAKSFLLAADIVKFTVDIDPQGIVKIQSREYSNELAKKNHEEEMFIAKCIGKGVGL